MNYNYSNGFDVSTIDIVIFKKIRIKYSDNIREGENTHIDLDFFKKRKEHETEMNIRFSLKFSND